MGDKSYPDPVLVTESGGVMKIRYDQVTVQIPADGPVPEDVPGLVRRVFNAMKDLRRDFCAE